MNKLSYLTLGAAGLLLASCSQEPIAPSVAADGEGNVSINVRIPKALTSRAVENFSEGTVANKLFYAVYDGSDNMTAKGMYVLDGTGEFTSEGEYLTTTVNLNLATGKTYDIAFFAQSEQSLEDGVYSFDGPTATMTVNYESMTSEGNLYDAYDCFYGLISVKPEGTTFQASAELTRPVAQVNWGTNDLSLPSISNDKAFGENGIYLNSALTISGVYTTLNLLNGQAEDMLDETTMPVFQGPCGYNIPFPVDPTTYAYAAMNYVLMPTQTSSVCNMTLTITNNATFEGVKGNGDVTKEVEVSSVPVQGNYRTNIYGNLLSEHVDVQVTKDPNWGGDDYLVGVGVEAPSQDEAGNYLLTTQANFEWFAQEVNNQNKEVQNGSFILQNDVYFTSDHTPIGLTTNYGFNGTFDGGGHTIYNMTISATGNNIGLFGYTQGAKISDLNFENVTINANNSSYVGVLLGNAGAVTINNVNLYGVIKINDAGRAVGGIVGNVYRGTVADCTIDVNEEESGITGTANYVGGIVGDVGRTGSTSATITGCKSNMDVTGSGIGVGGILGVAEHNTTVSECECTGNVTSNATSFPNYLHIGGIIGTWNNAEGNTITVTGCVENGKVTSPNATDAGYSLDNYYLVGAGYSQTGGGVLYINSEDASSDHGYPTQITD